MRPFFRHLAAAPALVIFGLFQTACANEHAPSPDPAREVVEADVVYVPTPYDVVAKMLEVAGVGKNDVLYDLGCGDGRIVVTAAQRYGCRGIGFDVDPQRVKESKAAVGQHKLEQLVKIQQQDIFKVDLRPASVISLYLLPSMNVRLIPQLDAMRPGSRIVTHDFDIEGVKPDKVIRMTSKEDGVGHIIYLFTTPLRKEATGQ
jgi:precorrin-6B methylase 2